jgi:diketogulonate reductase-like aldo/keto reductase
MDGMEELVEMDLVRSVGISNFDITGTEDVRESSGIPVSVNQIKIHPYHYPEEAIRFCQNRGIVVTAYSPLDTGGIVDDDLLTEIGESAGKSASQVSLRWLLDQNLVVIPKASTEKHLRKDIDIFDWEIPEKLSEKIDRLSRDSLRG